MPNEREQARAIAHELQRHAERATRGVAGAVMSELVESTRVDTGLTRANWIANRQAPRAEPVGSRTAAGVAEARRAQSASRAEIDAFILADGKLYIANAEGNVERLNDGRDAGFVQRAIARGVAAAVLGGTGRR